MSLSKVYFCLGMVLLAAVCCGRYVKKDRQSTLNLLNRENLENDNEVLSVYEEEDQGDESGTRIVLPEDGLALKEEYFLAYAGQFSQPKSQNENDESIFKDEEKVDHEEESKVKIDKGDWAKYRWANLSAENILQSPGSHKYFECQRCRFEIFKTLDDLDRLKEAYAQYAYNTSWHNAVSAFIEDSQGKEDVLHLPLVHRLQMAVVEFHRCAAFTAVETHRENETSSNNSSLYATENKESIVCLLSNSRDIVSVFGWLLNVVNLDVALVGREEKQYETLDKLTKLSSDIFNLQDIFLSELQHQGSKPNNAISREIVHREYEQVDQNDSFERGLVMLRLLSDYGAVLAKQQF